jgi:hypothetical protein
MRWWWCERRRRRRRDEASVRSVVRRPARRRMRSPDCGAARAQRQSVFWRARRTSPHHAETPRQRCVPTARHNMELRTASGPEIGRGCLLARVRSRAGRAGALPQPPAQRPGAKAGACERPAMAAWCARRCFSAESEAPLLTPAGGADCALASVGAAHAKPTGQLGPCLPRGMSSEAARSAGRREICCTPAKRHSMRLNAARACVGLRG